ncbi:gliding motility protein GldM [Mucilaginibacter calamicampi]|uniref:Gliding motility protein GldM n=1 Tax=Mucilaginibacter calamicampi TaxID=1302352 RepID=A0ABW2YQM9_9SPHI
MAGGRETPRQRMIGILYLVLLGLIALSIPDNLMDAFKNISDSLSASKKNVQTGIDNTYTAFEKTKMVEQAERAKPIYARAKQATKLADELTNYVESIKTELQDKTGGFDEAINDYKGRENTDVPVHILVDGKKAYDLHKKIDETREKLLALLNDKERNGINLALRADAPAERKGFPNRDWENANFGQGIPMGAAMTALVKVQADTKNAENEVVKKILGEVDQAVVNLDQFSAVAVAPSSYVLVGQPYTAEVFLTASDSKSSPDISVGGSNLPTEAGRGKYSGSTSAEGVHTWIGTIKVKQNDGSIKTYTTQPQTYTVARPSAVVSPDKMNVLYIGVPNPVSVSAPGIAKDKLRLSISSGNISGANGQYTVNVTSPGTATVSVSGELAPGKTSVLGSTLFRVKRIPPPKAQFAGKSGGTISSANIKAQDYVIAKLDGFDFDAKFRVTRFTLLILKPRQDVVRLVANGDELTPAMHQIMNTVTPNTTVVFTDIIGVGPDGVQNALDPIVINAN